MRLFLYTDGGSRGNPGPSAIGGVAFDVTDATTVYDGGTKCLEVFRFAEHLGADNHTNNEAEYLALLRGMQKAKDHNAKLVSCFLDSQLVVRQLTGVYGVKSQSIQYLVNEVVKLARSFDRVTYDWIPRSKNQTADALVNYALDQRAATSETLPGA